MLRCVNLWICGSWYCLHYIRDRGQLEKKKNPFPFRRLPQKVHEASATEPVIERAVAMWQLQLLQISTLISNRNDENKEVTPHVYNCTWAPMTSKVFSSSVGLYSGITLWTVSVYSCSWKTFNHLFLLTAYCVMSHFNCDRENTTQKSPPDPDEFSYRYNCIASKIVIIILGYHLIYLSFYITNIKN